MQVDGVFAGDNVLDGAAASLAGGLVGFGLVGHCGGGVVIREGRWAMRCAAFFVAGESNGSKDFESVRCGVDASEKLGTAAADWTR